ncbi:MAG: NifB/NifX family molybdenum-iron cluster-binding protein [Trichlorobacter sp.]|nr:NifB/NifX family molybdenum-iron cluster-binding protein [Trichlorobacter sp.]
MKLCFPVVQNEGLNSQLYGHFGSAPGFLVVDLESGQTSVVDNSNENHVHGACNPAKALAGLGLDGIVVGGIGRGALLSLNQAGYKVFQAQGAFVHENLELAKSGKLAEFAADAVCGGHSHGNQGCGDHDHNHQHGQARGGRSH